MAEEKITGRLYNVYISAVTLQVSYRFRLVYGV